VNLVDDSSISALIKLFNFFEWHLKKLFFDTSKKFTVLERGNQKISCEVDVDSKLRSEIKDSLKISIFDFRQ
jgi:hypothetical protein